ncbi:Hypothetical protein NGAL_HAMBI1146_51090 [Neorhizobium galegae bv. officinalis]|nr:Hypothetical protein NGAL_HAMBI1146_51090 [Neorhizobium galegae bv. officinalis]
MAVPCLQHMCAYWVITLKALQADGVLVYWHGDKRCILTNLGQATQSRHGQFVNPKSLSGLNAKKVGFRAKVIEAITALLDVAIPL